MNKSKKNSEKERTLWHGQTPEDCLGWSDLEQIAHGFVTWITSPERKPHG